ncbi:MAG: PaaI family thioesterase [Terriglobales bacterium]
MSDEELQSLFARAPFVQQYGFRFQSVDNAGTCTLHAPLNERFLRLDGIVSGPMLMAAADAAMWTAIVSKLGKSAAKAVTAEMKTNFLSAAKREEFWCTAKVLKAGSRLIFGTAECVAKDGRLLAHHTLTYIRPV